jgi:hypothetical protein
MSNTNRNRNNNSSAPQIILPKDGGIIINPVGQTQTPDQTPQTKTPTAVPKALTIERVENKSEMIRRMFFDENKSVATIAKETTIRYQMVRNIVKAEELKRAEVSGKNRDK